MTITVLADLIVALLLICTIYYAATLSRRLNALRADKAALQALVQSLAQASASAEAGVKGLKATADEVGRDLQRKLQAAQSLREDLAYMIDRGGTIADRMEASLRPRPEPAQASARPRPMETSRAPAEAPRRDARMGAGNFIQQMAARLAPEPASPPGTPSRAERDLLRALAGRR